MWLQANTPQRTRIRTPPLTDPHTRKYTSSTPQTNSASNSDKPLRLQSYAQTLAHKSNELDFGQKRAGGQVNIWVEVHYLLYKHMYVYAALRMYVCMLNANIAPTEFNMQLQIYLYLYTIYIYIYHINIYVFIHVYKYLHSLLLLYVPKCLCMRVCL